MLKRCSILTLAAIIALPAAAQDKPVEKPGKNDPNKVICRTVKSSASRLGGQRECHTKAEWDRATAQNGETVRNAAVGGR